MAFFADCRCLYSYSRHAAFCNTTRYPRDLRTCNLGEPSRGYTRQPHCFRTSSLEFQLMQMVVDNWRYQGGHIQIRCPVEIRNDIGEILVGLKASDLQYSLSSPVNRDTRCPHDSDSIRLTERFVVLLGNNER